MSASDAMGSALPGGMKPAQAGLVLVGRVTCGHLAATIVDLDERGVVKVEQLSGSDSRHWLLTRLASGHQGGDVLAYERTLLKLLFADGDRFRLSELTDSYASGLSRVRDQLVRDAVRRGWLKRWRKGERTKDGDQLLTQLRAFRHRLRRSGIPGHQGGLPYALLFGLLQEPSRLPGRSQVLALFAEAWSEKCSELPGWRPPEPKPRAEPEIPTGGDQWGGLPIGMRPGR